MTALSSAAYWSRRDLLERQRLLNRSIDQTDALLAVQYAICQRNTVNRIEALYNELLAKSEDGTILLSDLYRYNKYYELQADLLKKLEELGRAEVKAIDKKLVEQYLANRQMIDEQLGIAPEYDDKASAEFFTKYREDKAREVINTVWADDGKNWSERIWGNKDILQIELTKGLADCIAAGLSSEELRRTLVERFGQSYRNADRLVRTEMCHITEQSTLHGYEEAGIETYTYVCNLYEVCKDCTALGGQVFKVSDAREGVNYPPMHPNCRCTTVANISID